MENYQYSGENAAVLLMWFHCVMLYIKFSKMNTDYIHMARPGDGKPKQC